MEGWSSQGGGIEGWGSWVGEVEGRDVTRVTWAAALVVFLGSVLVPWQVWQQEGLNLNQGWMPCSECVLWFAGEKHIMF